MTKNKLLRRLEQANMLHRRFKQLLLKLQCNMFATRGCASLSHFFAQFSIQSYLSLAL